MAKLLMSLTHTDGSMYSLINVGKVTKKVKTHGSVCQEKMLITQGGFLKWAWVAKFQTMRNNEKYSKESLDEIPSHDSNREKITRVLLHHSKVSLIRIKFWEVNT